MANPRKTTSPKAWKKRTGGVELELPSGNICKVKRPGMEKLLSTGIMPDSLTPIAIEAIKESERGGKPDDSAVDAVILDEMLKDQNAIADIFLAFDKVTAMCVVEPKVLLHIDEDGNEIPEEDRDEEMLYTDEVDMDDKSFIFNFVIGGTKDLEQFREQSSSSVAALQSGEDVGV